MSEPASTWRFPTAFWTANVIELFERAAYYGTFIELAHYLTATVGYRDAWANSIAGIFAAGLYLLPFFNGAAADRLGFRRSLCAAFALLAAGYAALGLYPTRGPVLLALLLIMVGGAFVKPIISGTVARCSDEANRARAYSLFYMIVNIGSFSGKTVAKPVRRRLGLRHVPLYSAGASGLALVLVSLFYWPKSAADKAARSAHRTLVELRTVLRNGRFLALVLITAGFWAIQGQLYASMPKYVLRMVGPDASPEWYANVNPLVVVLLVVPITQLVRRIPPVSAILVALALIPCSALCMALSPALGGPVSLFGASLHPITVAMVAGITVQGVAECFLSPRYLEYASKQAPPGQEGLYMGYSHLNIFFAWLTGFVLSGFLLEAFCPDPRTLSAAEQLRHQAALKGLGPMPAAYHRAHFIWYVFCGIGLCAFALLLVFRRVTARLDRRAGPNDREAAPGEDP
jgi:dipeptide/tripeptide permease